MLKKERKRSSGGKGWGEGVGGRGGGKGWEEEVGGGGGRKRWGIVYCCP